MRFRDRTRRPEQDPPGPRMSSEIFEEALRTDGGFTYDPRRVEAPTSGVYASKYGYETAYEGGATGFDIDSYQAEHADVLSSPRNYFGGWRSDVRGKEADMLDVTQRFETREEADVFARQNAQNAYFDLDTFEEIETNYSPYRKVPAHPTTASADSLLGQQAADIQLRARAGEMNLVEAGRQIADLTMQRQHVNKSLR